MADSTLDLIAQGVREDILKATNQAGSGHPTSSLSATDLMVALMFGGHFRYDIDNPDCPANDRLIFSKGHASPLFYSLWKAAGALDEDELLSYRSFGSSLEGHPAVIFPYVDVATGSLGQGLSIGVGMALGGKYLDELPCRVFVLLGDSEMAEGSQWEAIQLAAHYKLNNLVAVLDVNRLGQRGETMYGHDLDAYRRRLDAFDWETLVIDGHSLEDIDDAYTQAAQVKDKPVMIIAKTVKGKGVPSVEGRDNYHGKALGEDALEELRQHGPDISGRTIRGTIEPPPEQTPLRQEPVDSEPIHYTLGEKVATRDAYGSGLERLFPACPAIVSLDAEVSNSTRAQTFAEAHPDRFFEMFIAEQNMVGAALGLSCRGRIPFVSTFAAFLTRAFDQIRMSQYSDPHLVFVGSHAGVSIGEDGPSQMGLEDLAMFRSLRDSVVLYPSDAVATERLVEVAATRRGITYLRTTRAKTPVIYASDELFFVGGSQTLRSSDRDVLTVLTAGYTVHEALAAHDILCDEHIPIRVIDLYSVKPLDDETIKRAAQQTDHILVVEDHYPQGGLGEAVFSALRNTTVRKHHVAVTKQPRSGDKDRQLAYQGLSSEALVATVKEILQS